MDAGIITSTLLALNKEIANPLPTDEVVRIARSVSRYEPGLELTEIGLASRFAEIASPTLRYSPAQGWMAYNGKVWRRDTQRVHVQECAKRFLNELRAQAETIELSDPRAQAELMKAVRRLQKQGTAANIAQLARSDGAILDEQAWTDAAGLLNFQNGTLDLGTMKLRDHAPDDRITKVLPFNYDPDATSPCFDRVLTDSLGPEERDFVMELFGHSLQGSGSLQKLLILSGRGRNGKTTIVEAVANAMGEYATSANPTSFVKAHNKSNVNNDIAALNGARLVVTSELNTGQTLDAALVKKMTGDETIVARFLYGENFEFAFTGLLTLVTNFAPVFDGSDMAMGRRMVSVVFRHTVAEADVDASLPAKLRDEAAGIMNRLLQGLLRFREKGLCIPESVQLDTAALIRDGNQVQQFLDACCEVEQGSRLASGRLFQAYRMWAMAEGLAPMSAPSFRSSLIRTLDVEPKRIAAGWCWPNLKLRPPH